MMAIRGYKKRSMKKTSLLEIKEELKKISQNKSGSFAKLELTKDERKLVHDIKEMTGKLNVNNVTRTQAYFDFYRQHPEIHWALLGHMVSRNGGWHMTDLKGDLLTKLMSEKEQKNFFLFLERGNWLIFQDVFPQFLLYKQSLKLNKNLFYLLPYLNVSQFMETIWNYFWEHSDCSLLTIATIINEQSYLEKRVIQNHHFKKTVLNTIGFKLYDFLRFNQIIFPIYRKGKTEKPYLMGETLQHFESLHERIMLGKRLYSLLFQKESIFQGVLLWASNHSHTGSRKDYWNHLFHSINESLPGSIYRKRTKKCQLKKGAKRIYSPPLPFAWKNVDHQEAEKGDWFDDWRIVDYLMEEEKDVGGKIYDDYCKTIEKIELAIIAKKAIFLRRE
ncbi:DUF2515 domain-containing protein [Rossellomorea sp. BNER]|uniref:DUF2515 domain-containing protein n=1 Tax=Rossellomorea sp. BNER TaxID=2962031 RepID=UPI003AF251B1